MLEPESTPEPEPLMAALRRQRPVQLADVAFGGPVKEATEALPEANDPDRTKRQVEVAGQAYKKQQQQQQQPQPDVKDRYIVALESALLQVQTLNKKLSDELLVQTKLVKANQASNFAVLLQKLGGLEAQVALLQVPEPELEMPQTPEPEPEKPDEKALSKCLEHLLKEVSREPVTLMDVDQAVQRATGQVLERLDQLELQLNATFAWIKTGFFRVENKTVAVVNQLEKSFNSSRDESSDRFHHIDQDSRKTATAMDRLEKNFNTSQDACLQRFDQFEKQSEKRLTSVHQRFDAQDLVLNKTYILNLNQSAVIGACVTNGLNGKRFFGRWWEQFNNILHGTVPENSELYHAQNMEELFDSEKILILFFGLIFWFIRGIDGRGGSRLARKWRLRQRIIHKAFKIIQSNGFSLLLETSWQQQRAQMF